MARRDLPVNLHLELLSTEVSSDCSHCNTSLKYSRTCLKWPLKNRQNKDLKTNGSLMKVESIAECSLGAFCNTFDLH